MTLITRLAAAALKLPPATTYDLAVERNLEVPMPDGARLLADRWYPRTQAGGPPPVILIRTPYGRSTSEFIARLAVERGHQVVVQSSRGTFGSGGTWQPFRHEAVDGQATLAWLVKQPWCDGRIATWGASYQGLSQWALVANPGKALRALVIVQSDPDPRSIIYSGGVLSLETVLAWTSILEYQERSLVRILANALWGDRSLRPAFSALPLRDSDRVAFGRTIDFYQEWLAHEPSDAWWNAVDFGRDLAQVPPTVMVGGWFDLHLPGQLDAWCTLKAAGREVRLVIGPWTHESFGIAGPALLEGLGWFDRALKSPGGENRPGPSQPSLRFFLMGRGRWVDLDAWPPPADVQLWHLHGDARLARPAPTEAPPRRYTYDPAQPTPSLGGGATIVGQTSGPKDQQARERRPDVITYTSEALTEELTVVGPLKATLYIRADIEHIDLFVRLCDVTPRGRSINVSDGIVRLRPADFAACTGGALGVHVSLWPTAITFKAGHRLRLQVSSGAHPMYARNLCTGEPLASGAQTWKATIDVLSDPRHPSAIEVPVVKI